MKRVALLLVGILCLSSCAPAAWEKSGTSQQDIDRDEYACKQEATQSGLQDYNPSIVGEADYITFVNKCMEARGYHQYTAMESMFPPAGQDLYFQGHDALAAGDYTQAKSLFEQSAAKGNARGMNGLGVLYALGAGVSKDCGQARAWIAKAYSNGLGIAEDNLRSGVNGACQW